MFLLELVIDLVTAMLPGRRAPADRSVVGESELDRSAQMLWVWVVAGISGLAGLVGAVWWWMQ